MTKRILTLFISIMLLLPAFASPLWANPSAPSWLLINSSAPARYNHKCAYDIDRDKVVLFGGLDSIQTWNNDIWEFSESQGWSQIQASGPEGREGHGLCYDTTAHLTILFGGHNQSGQNLNDTWSWDGTSWTKLDSTGPSPRAFHVMAYDSQRQRIVLFGGGATDTIFNDTWEWDGSQWLLRATSGPAPRVAAGMAYNDRYNYPDIPIGSSILFGGQAAFDDTAFNDTWTWNGDAWSQLQTDQAPSPRVGHSMAFCVMPGGITLFGGQSVSLQATIFGTTWQIFPNFDTTWYQAFPLYEPPARSLADMISYHGNILLIGGENGATIYNDVWVYPVFLPPYVVGDVNNSRSFTGLDVVYAVSYFKGGPPPPYSMECTPGNVWYVSGDVNNSCSFTGLDVSYMVAFLKGGPVLRPCPYCPPGR